MSRTIEETQGEQPWWLEEGDHLCDSCGHGFHLEALCSCFTCDSYVCCHCVQALPVKGMGFPESFHRHCAACVSNNRPGNDSSGDSEP